VPDPFVALRDRVGQEVGVSDWLTVDQTLTDAFAKATLDPDPMHVDPEWCARYSPFRSTIGFGFHTISLLTYFSHQALGWMHDDREGGGGYGLNYGFDRVRLLNPVRIGSRIRARFTLLSHAETRPGEHRNTLAATIEIEGEAKPALYAEWLGLWIEGEAGHDRLVARHGGAEPT
jgi:acyl dehydratase